MIDFYFLKLYVSVQVCVYVSAGLHRVQKRALDALELDLPVVVIDLVWVLRTQLCSSAKVVHALNL